MDRLYLRDGAHIRIISSDLRAMRRREMGISPHSPVKL
jgi:hypothetical protein